MRSEQLRSTTNELRTTHALATCWCHLQERECAVLEAEHEDPLMEDEVASLYLNIAPRLPTSSRISRSSAGATLTQTPGQDDTRARRDRRHQRWSSG